MEARRRNITSARYSGRKRNWLAGDGPIDRRPVNPRFNGRSSENQKSGKTAWKSVSATSHGCAARCVGRGWVRVRARTSDVSRRRSPLSSRQVKTAQTGNEQEQERSSPVRAICIQRPCCRERGEVAINNATHHQYLAGITARTPIHRENAGRQRVEGKERREEEREEERGVKRGRMDACVHAA